MKRSALPPRTSRLSPRSKEREAKRAEESITRELVFARDGHRCRLAVAGQERAYDVGSCFGRLTFHHVRKASQGGAYAVENGATLCSSHNDRLEAEPELAAFARSVGLVRRRGD